MRRYFIIIWILLLTRVAYGQDVVTIKHKTYTTTFSKSMGYPVLVEWWVTKVMLGCPTKVRRTDNFQPDPLLQNETDLQKYYGGSGFDRGHNFPAADGGCDMTAMFESFYFSNMTPQYPQLNRGDWKELEEATRIEAMEKDSVKIWCGSLGEIKRIGNLAIPRYCWKVIYVKKTNKYKAYLFDNATTKPDGFQNNEVPLSRVQQLTGFKFM